jgi:hypothetical protein
MSDDYYNDDMPELEEDEMESYNSYLHGDEEEDEDDDDYESEDASW